MKKRILVAGGAGFLGSHLCDCLISKGHEVLCVDNFYTGRKQNIQHLLTHPNFELMRHDITFPLYVEVDEIYNLASPASPVHYQKYPVQTIKTNVVGTINLLGLAKRLNIRLLQASTSEVYGDPQVHPQVEGYWGHVNPIGPRACYDEGKRCAETLCCDYARQFNLDIKVVRIFNTYGPRMSPNDGRVVSNLIMQALQGKSLTLHGNGQQSRSFCYVDDLIDGMVAMMASGGDFQGPVNLGNPNELSMHDLAELIRQLSGFSSKIVYVTLPADDPKRRQPDIGLAKQCLQWQPKVSLRDGLQKTISYFNQQLKQMSQQEVTDAGLVFSADKAKE